MSAMDFIYAIKPLPVSTGAYGAVGSTQTCTAAGFWGQGRCYHRVFTTGA